MSGSWQAPELRVAGDVLEERHATWLELVYDLVFVVAVAQLAHHLEEHPDAAGLAEFAGLFVPVWWAWAGQVFYANRFDTDDASHRVFASLQMVGVAVLAAAVPTATRDGAAAFALAYAFVRAVLVAQYLRAWRHVPAARPLTGRYAVGFSAATALWLASLAVPAPGRFLVWGVATAVDLATPLASRRHQAALPPQPRHLPERFGLFTLIVLGESVVSIVAGLQEQGLSLTAVAIALLGTVLVLSIWWLYFDNIDETIVLRTQAAGQVWVYGHLPLVMGLTALGVGIRALTLAPAGAPVAAGERLLVCGALAAVLAVLALLHAAEGDRRQALTRLAGAAAALLVGLLAGGQRPVGVAAALAVVGVTQVLVDVRHAGAEAALPRAPANDGRSSA